MVRPWRSRSGSSVALGPRSAGCAGRLAALRVASWSTWSASRGCSPPRRSRVGRAPAGGPPCPNLRSGSTGRGLLGSRFGRSRLDPPRPTVATAPGRVGCLAREPLVDLWFGLGDPGPGLRSRFGPRSAGCAGRLAALRVASWSTWSASRGCSPPRRSRVGRAPAGGPPCPNLRSGSTGRGLLGSRFGRSRLDPPRPTVALVTRFARFGHRVWDCRPFGSAGVSRVSPRRSSVASTTSVSTFRGLVHPSTRRSAVDARPVWPLERLRLGRGRREARSVLVATPAGWRGSDRASRARREWSGAVGLAHFRSARLATPAGWRLLDRASRARREWSGAVGLAHFDPCGSLRRPAGVFSIALCALDGIGRGRGCRGFSIGAARYAGRLASFRSRFARSTELVGGRGCRGFPTVLGAPARGLAVFVAVGFAIGAVRSRLAGGEELLEFGVGRLRGSGPVRSSTRVDTPPDRRAAAVPDLED